MAAKKEDYRITRGKALEAEKKRVAANSNKKVVLPSKENMKNVVGLALTVAGPGKVVKGAQLAAKVVKAGSEGRAVARGLKAANKPTKASKTTIGNNNKVAVEVRRGMLKNSPPLREGRVRGGGMATLKRQEIEKNQKEIVRVSNPASKKLDQLDRRSKTVAPGKKYSDMTSAEKRKFNSLNAEYVNRIAKNK